MEKKKGRWKGLEQQQRARPTSRESLKYTRHHSSGWDCAIMCSAMHKGCLSSNTPQLQHHVLASAQPKEVQNISRRQRLYSLQHPASCKPTHQSALSQIETFEIPGELLASDPHTLLPCQQCELAPSTQASVSKVIEEILFLCRAGKG